MWRAPIAIPLSSLIVQDEIQDIVVVIKRFTDSHDNDMADAFILTTFIKSISEPAWFALRFHRYWGHVVSKIKPEAQKVTTEYTADLSGHTDWQPVCDASVLSQSTCHQAIRKDT